MAAWRELTDTELQKLPTHRLYQVYKLCRNADNHCHDWDEQTPADLENIRKREYIKLLLDNRGHVERDIPEERTNLGKMRSYWANYSASEVKTKKGPIKDALDCIGKQVMKRSKKPFKSKAKYNTVKAVTTNPHTQREAFEFIEDTSIVDVHVCKVRSK